MSPAPIRIALITRCATGTGALDDQDSRLRASVSEMHARHVTTRTFRDGAASGRPLTTPDELRAPVLASLARDVSTLAL